MTLPEYRIRIATEAALAAAEREALALPSLLPLAWAGALLAVGSAISLLCTLVAFGVSL